MVSEKTIVEYRPKSVDRPATIWMAKQTLWYKRTREADDGEKPRRAPNDMEAVKVDTNT